MKKIRHIAALLFAVMLLGIIPAQMAGATNAESSLDVKVGKKNYTISNTFTNDEIPTGYKQATMQYNGYGIAILLSPDESITLVYLVQEGKETGKFFLYDKDSGKFSKFIFINGADFYLKVSEPDESVTIPEGYEAASLDINGSDVSAWQNPSESSDMYLIYGTNQDGEEGLYLYDVKGGTFQRYIEQTGMDAGIREQENEPEAQTAQPVNPIIKRFNLDEDLLFKIGCGLVLFSVLLLFIILNLILKVRAYKYDYDDEDDEDFYDEEEEIESSDEKEKDDSSVHYITEPVSPQKEEMAGKEPDSDDDIEIELEDISAQIEAEAERQAAAEIAAVKPEKKIKIELPEELLPKTEEEIPDDIEEALYAGLEELNLELDVGNEPVKEEPQVKKQEKTIQEEIESYDDFELEILDLDTDD